MSDQNRFLRVMLWIALTLCVLGIFSGSILLIAGVPPIDPHFPSWIPAWMTTERFDLLTDDMWEAFLLLLLLRAWRREREAWQ